MESMANNILTTKLEVPSATAGILERQRLFKLLGNQTPKPVSKQVETGFDRVWGPFYFLLFRITG